MKKITTVLILLAILSVGKLYAQPGFSIHAYGGYDLPLPDFKGTYPGDLPDDPPRYFQKYGINVGLDGKYFFGKPRKDAKGRNFGVTLSLNYHNFTSGKITTDPTDPLYGDSAASFKSEFNVFSAGLGVEYDVRPNSHLNPFFGAEMTANVFSGQFTRNLTNGQELEDKQDTETRLGFAVGFGMDISVQRNFGIIWGAKYHLANVVGKDTNSSGDTKPHLNDGKTSTHGARLISWLGLYLGASIYFDRPKGTKKKMSM